MVATKFPDPKRSEGFFYDALWKDNILLNAKSKSIRYHNKSGPLSVKFTLAGREEYFLKNVPISVDPHSLLIINSNHKYSSEINSDSLVDSFSIYFKKNLEKQVFYGLTSSDSYLLENPDYTPNSVEFVEIRQDRSKKINAIVSVLKSNLLSGSLDRDFLNEKSIDLLEELIKLNYKLYMKSQNLKFIKASTRFEIFKRVSLAKEYIDSCYTKGLALREIAAIACMSEYHFLRSFKSVFGLSPYQYVIRCRLDKSLILLKNTTKTIIDIALEVGYENVKSFRKAFKQRFKKTPLEIRSTLKI